MVYWLMCYIYAIVMYSLALAYIADDHLIVAEGVASLLKATRQVQDVRIFANGKSMLNACKAQVPEIVFLDYEMPGMSGMNTLKMLKLEFAGIPVLMLSMNNEKSIIAACIDAGANGYLSKDSTPAELEEAIFAVKSGEIYYSREVLKALAGVRPPAEKIGNMEVDLSVREREILKFICDGLTPKEIADKLFLSKRTVDTHKSNIMQKLDVSTVGKLISVALQNNIVR